MNNTSIRLYTSKKGGRGRGGQVHQPGGMHMATCVLAVERPLLEHYGGRGISPHLDEWT